MPVAKKPRPRPGFLHEEAASGRGFLRIAGVDEVGRGPLAGPVVAAAVVLPPDFDHPHLNDSKKLTPARRALVEQALKDSPDITWAVAEASVEEIDRINILQASLLAMKRAVQALSPAADFLLVDGNRGMRGPLPEQPIVKGDGVSRSIAAASILAKEYRDRLMRDLGELYPAYGFGQHSGYPTKAHKAALATHGLCPHHRRSFCRQASTPGARP